MPDFFKKRIKPFPVQNGKYQTFFGKKV